MKHHIKTTNENSKFLDRLQPCNLPKLKYYSLAFLTFRLSRESFMSRWVTYYLLQNETFHSWKTKKGGGGMVQGQVFLKEGVGWGGGRGVRTRHFSYLIFSRFILFTFTNSFTLCKIVLYIWWKVIFSVTIILWKNYEKFILNCLKMNLKISHKLR